MTDNKILADLPNGRYAVIVFNGMVISATSVSGSSFIFESAELPALIAQNGMFAPACLAAIAAALQDAGYYPSATDSR